jgi:hypothetical protein
MRFLTNQDLTSWLALVLSVFSMSWVWRNRATMFKYRKKRDAIADFITRSLSGAGEWRMIFSGIAPFRRLNAYFYRLSPVKQKTHRTCLPPPSNALIAGSPARMST